MKKITEDAVTTSSFYPSNPLNFSLPMRRRFKNRKIEGPYSFSKQYQKIKIQRNNVDLEKYKKDLK